MSDAAHRAPCARGKWNNNSFAVPAEEDESSGCHLYKEPQLKTRTPTAIGDRQEHVRHADQ